MLVLWWSTFASTFAFSVIFGLHLLLVLGLYAFREYLQSKFVISLSNKKSIYPSKKWLFWIVFSGIAGASLKRVPGVDSCRSSVIFFYSSRLDSHFFEMDIKEPRRETRTVATCYNHRSYFAKKIVTNRSHFVIKMLSKFIINRVQRTL